MNAYLQPGNAPVVEAAAINGVGVTATLRAAVARILDNLKNNVDTSLSEQPELAAPDMKAKSGVTSSSAGTPKVGVGMQAPTFVKPIAAAPQEEEPFGGVAVAEPEIEIDSREDLQSLLAGARQLVASLEAALERARAHERELADKIARR